MRPFERPGDTEDPIFAREIVTVVTVLGLALVLLLVAQRL